jgi:hypothetical protein
MALTIEINHARTRAKAVAAGSGQPVMPHAVEGRIRRIKWFVLLLTLSIYYVAPFLRWDRGPNAPDQALLLDFVHGRLYFFFAEITAMNPREAELVFTARDESGTTILSAIDRFVER